MPKKKQENYQTPQTLLEAARHFSDPEVCVQFVKKFRWIDGATCPHCGSKKNRYIKTRRKWCCKDCKKQFSVIVGTVFEDSKIQLDKWMLAVWMLANCKNGVSSWEIHRAIGVTQKTAWFMLHRIRLAMQNGSFEKLKGEVEADETFIGGKARNMHKGQRKVKGSGTMGKEVVMGLLDRHTRQVRVKHVEGTKKKHTAAEVRSHVEPGSEVFTDALKSYSGLSDEYVHGFVDHAEKYVDGKIHTNGLENFWSLLKRAVKGTYVSIMPFHLFRYLDEQSYRFNKRDGHDSERFMEVLMGIKNKRLMYKDLIAKDSDEAITEDCPSPPEILDVAVERIIEPFPF
ncbi:MAG: IS1595 family transposase [Pirellulaceae bacterium]